MVLNLSRIPLLPFYRHANEALLQLTRYGAETRQRRQDPLSSRALLQTLYYRSHYTEFEEEKDTHSFTMIPYHLYFRHILSEPRCNEYSTRCRAMLTHSTRRKRRNRYIHVFNRAFMDRPSMKAHEFYGLSPLIELTNADTPPKTLYHDYFSDDTSLSALLGRLLDTTLQREHDIYRNDIDEVVESMLQGVDDNNKIQSHEV